MHGEATAGRPIHAVSPPNRSRLAEAPGTERSGRRKSCKPKYPMHAALGTLATSRLGPGCDILAYIWPQSWWKPETLALPIRPGCAFDPKGDSRHHASDQSLKLFPDRPTTTSCLTRRSPPPVRAPPRSLPAGTLSGFTISNGLRQSLNHRLARIQKRRSASLTRGRGCRRCSTTNCWQRQRFPRLAALLA